MEGAPNGYYLSISRTYILAGKRTWAEQDSDSATKIKYDHPLLLLYVTLCYVICHFVHQRLPKTNLQKEAYSTPQYPYLRLYELTGFTGQYVRRRALE